ncbi:MAG: helix-turn-helix domain-containing protein [Deltaproteobacteria bacterium]|nr:helix-turn-helix domain-containing protein [Deltaproteobacteria bacterium]
MYLTVKNLSQLLNVSPAVVYRMVNDKKLPPPVRIYNSIYRWERDFIVSWLKDNLGKICPEDPPIPASSESVPSDSPHGSKRRGRPSARNAPVAVQSNPSYNRAHLASLTPSPGSREGRSDRSNIPDSEKPR